ncbi:hypothetical protein HanPSC8_Chr17g0750501 [Helianthus annuus]|nr:hypothetical protein HanPSC8_Chr17g0750501 [Helianthus annuus]
MLIGGLAMIFEQNPPNPQILFNTHLSFNPLDQFLYIFSYILYFVIKLMSFVEF